MSEAKQVAAMAWTKAQSYVVLGAMQAKAIVLVVELVSKVHVSQTWGAPHDVLRTVGKTVSLAGVALQEMANDAANIARWEAGQ